MTEHSSGDEQAGAPQGAVVSHLEVDSGIVVGDDGSGSSQQAVQWAAEEAALHGCDLHVVRAWTMSNAPRPSQWSFGYVPTWPEYEVAVADVLAHNWDGLAERVPALHLHAVHGDPARIIVESSLAADLVVVGSRGHGRVAEFVLGSVADEVVRSARCPVVVVRASTTTPLPPAD